MRGRATGEIAWRLVYFGYGGPDNFIDININSKQGTTNPLKARLRNEIVPR